MECPHCGGCLGNSWWRREHPDAPSDNNMVRASARYARSGVHGAYGAHELPNTLRR
jgi:hypothetical protein